MSKRWLSTLCFGLLAVALASPALAQEPIRFGVAGAHSGELASYGTPTLNAATIIIDEYNANGGLLGCPIQIYAQDDQCKSEIATNAATRLISDQVNVVLGHICTGPTKAALPLYTAARIISMSPSATAPSLTEDGNSPFFFRTIATDTASGVVGAHFAREVLNAQRVAILHDNTEYGKGYADRVREEILAIGGAEVVLFEAVTPGAPDYSSAVRKVRQNNADVLFWGGYYPEASKILANMNDLDIDIPMVGPDGLKDMGFIELAGQDAEGVYAAGPADTSDNALSQYWAAKHQERFGTPPGAFFDNGVAATLALLEGIKNAGSTDTDAIVNALRTVEVDTPVGRIKFDEKGDAVGVGMSIYQIQNGQYVEVYVGN